MPVPDLRTPRLSPCCASSVGTVSRQSLFAGGTAFFQPIPEGDPRLASKPLAAKRALAASPIVGGNQWGPSILTLPMPEGRGFAALVGKAPSPRTEGVSMIQVCSKPTLRTGGHQLHSPVGAPSCTAE